jgi:hypothetical protein
MAIVTTKVEEAVLRKSSSQKERDEILRKIEGGNYEAEMHSIPQLKQAWGDASKACL